MSKNPAAHQEGEGASVSRRCDYCFSCYQCAEQVSVSLWDVETGTIRKMYSCRMAGNVTVSSRSDGRAVNITLLGTSYLLCAPRAVPFIYVWNLLKASIYLGNLHVAYNAPISCMPGRLPHVQEPVGVIGDFIFCNIKLPHPSEQVSGSNPP